MNRKALELQINLMLQRASDLLSDVALLSSTTATRSDSPYLLNLLAFEILLKAAVRIHDGDPGTRHNYRELFDRLPADVRARVLKIGLEARRTADLTDLDGILDALSANFIDLRYPYERYAELGEEEYVNRGERWLAAGAALQDADFVYHPAELNALTHGLHVEVGAWVRDVPGTAAPA